MNFNFTFKSFLLIFFSALYATTYNVPSTQYPSIQSALSIAQDGDTVLVASGTTTNPITYTENLLIETGVTLLSAGGYQTTIIDGSNPADNMGSTITIRPASGSDEIPPNIEIDGFTITGGIGNLMDIMVDDSDTRTLITTRVGGGIMAFNTSPKIKNNNIKENGNASTSNGGGIIAIDSAEDWSFNDREWVLHPDLPPVTDELDLSDNIFYGNEAISAKTLFVDGFEELSTNLSNSTFDCYSSDYQDVSEYWVKGELTEFNYEGSDGIEFIYTDVWVNPETGIDELNTTGDINNPFKTIHFALSMIYPTYEDPITIHLTSGVFSPDSGEIFPIILSENVNLIGEGEANTIINAMNSGSTMIKYGEPTDYLSDFGDFNANTLLQNNVLRDFTITGAGYISGTWGPNGIGLFIIGNILVENITITENNGTGVSVNGNPFFKNVNITKNTVSYPSSSEGGGMSIHGSPILFNVNISENFTHRQGGGIWMEGENVQPLLINVIISKNAAPEGGAINITGYANPTLQNVTITENMAFETNMGQGQWPGVVIDDGSIQMNSSIVWGNMNGNYWCAGGFDASGCQILNYDNNFIINNNPNYSDYIQLSNIYYNYMSEDIGSGYFDPTYNASDNFSTYTNPLLNEDFTLQEGSPCINTGNPNPFFNNFDYTRNDIGFTGGSNIYPSFINFDYGLLGIDGYTEYLKIFNFRNEPLDINSINFNNEYFISETSFPLTVYPVDIMASISITCTPQEFGQLNGSINIYDDSSLIGQIDLSAYIMEGNILHGPLTGTLESNSYEVVDDIYINEGDTLVIHPGSELLFNGPYGFYINGGVLKAEGTDANNIIFKNYEENLSEENRWRGFGLYNVTDETIFDYVQISGARNEIYDDDTYGGGMALAFSHPILKNTLIYDNMVRGAGGGMYLSWSNPILSNVSITGNKSLDGGGIYLDNSLPIFDGVIISDNIALCGGGIHAGTYFNYGSYDSFNDAMINNLLIKNNKVDVIDINSTFNLNFSTEVGGKGAGIFLVPKAQSTIACQDDNECSRIILENLVIVNNQALSTAGYAASSGGGIFVSPGNGGGTRTEVIMNNVTISGNEADIGGGIYSNSTNGSYQQSTKLINSIIQGNIPQSIHTGNWITLISLYSNLDTSESGEGNIILWEGNIDLNPQFTNPNPEVADYTLQMGSPCIDQGIDYFDFEDIEGYSNAFILDIPEDLYVDGNDDGISIPDMGAYEYFPEQQNGSGDLNGDGSINVIDIVALVNIILNDLDTQGADFNGDGTVNVIDVVALVQFVLNN